MKIIPVVFWLLVFQVQSQSVEEIKIGIMTDVQYCDCPPAGLRQYRLSLKKLDSAVTVFNSQPLDAVFHLGDITDRNEKSIDSILPRFGHIKAPLFLVLGNHEYMIAKDVRPSVQKRIGLKDPFYTYDIGSWRFIILNGNDLSFFAPQTKEQRKERNQMVLGLYERFHFNGMPWNGGIGLLQMNWLKDRLQEADNESKKVIVMCHFPLTGKENHILFNNKEVLGVLSGHSCVKAYFCGHFHEGGYDVHDGIHLVNFKGMVNTAANSFAVVTLKNDSILIQGYGREPVRKLKTR